MPRSTSLSIVFSSSKIEAASTTCADSTIPEPFEAVFAAGLAVLTVTYETCTGDCLEMRCDTANEDM